MSNHVAGDMGVFLNQRGDGVFGDIQMMEDEFEVKGETGVYMIYHLLCMLALPIPADITLGPD